MRMQRTAWFAALALAAGCATSEQAQRSKTQTAQGQALQQLQRAEQAQQKAIEEQKQVESAQRDVMQKQKAVAEAEARLRGQRAKANQAQQYARELVQQASQNAAAQQQQVAQLQQMHARQAAGANQSRLQKWTQQRTVQGTVVDAGGESLQVRDSADQKLKTLQLTDATAVSVDGKPASVSKIEKGNDVRATYQTVDGQATAVRIEVTSNHAASGGNPGSSGSQQQ